MLIMAFPVVSNVFFTDSSMLFVLKNSCLNRAKKWIVSSTAIPNAIEKVIAVDGLNYTAHGDEVNIVALIALMNKGLGTSIVVG